MPRVPLVVLDASLAIARLRVEEQTPAIIDRFREWSIEGARLVVPRPFWWEVVNTLLIRHRQTGEQVLEAVHMLETFRIETRDLDRGQLLLAIGAVERFRITAYDAQYLVLAETLACDLATLDRDLARAAGSARYRDRRHRPRPSTVGGASAIRARRDLAGLQARLRLPGVPARGGGPPELRVGSCVTRAVVGGAGTCAGVPAVPRAAAVPLARGVSLFRPVRRVHGVTIWETQALLRCAMVRGMHRSDDLTVVLGR